MLKGINQWCFNDNTPLETVLSVSSKAGYAAVELNLYEPGGVGLTMDTTVAEALEIRKLAQQYNIQLRSLSTGLLWQHPLSSEDPAVQARGRDVVSKQLQLAAALEIDTVLVVPGSVNENTSYQDCYLRSQEQLKILSEEAAKLGVRIGVENVWNKFLLSPLEAARYVDELNSPYVGFYFDVGNVLQFGYPEQWIRILGSRILKVHVKDYKTGTGTGHGFVPLLAGNVNWPAVRQALEDIGYTDTLTAELSPYDSDSLQMVYDTSRHLDVILGASAR